MKNFILILFLLIVQNCLAISTYAYSEQINYEEQNINKYPISFIMPTKYLIEEDYNIYKLGGKSVYGKIIEKINECKKYNHTNFDLKYLELTKKMLDNILANKPVYKINIDNYEYSKISKETKDVISHINALIKNIYVSDIQIYEISHKEIERIQEKYKKDKNNMKQNSELISRLDQDKELINNTYNYLLKNPIFFSSKNYSSIQDFKENIDNIKKDFDNLSNEIFKYSYLYEKIKYNNWANRNNKKKVAGRLYEAIYAPYFNAKNGLYVHGARFDYPIQVISTAPNGVFLSGEYGLGGAEPRSIFLITSETYVDGQWINEPIVAEYKGIYDYTTILGGHKRVYKFYKYGKNEIDVNFKIPNETFYFFSAY